MTIPKLKLVLRDARIKPAVNEMELHPHFQQPELFRFVVENGIAPIGYCPIGSPGRPERDRTPEDTAPTEDPVVVKIAERHGVHPASICIQWAVQRGQTPIPFSVTPRNYAANLRAAAHASLSDEEMREIAGIDRNCRLIKGQVFLWKDGQTWEDLWDVSGEITA
jgi:diketogulonate reductase-like aldo/keto reductase